MKKGKNVVTQNNPTHWYFYTKNCNLHQLYLEVDPILRTG